MKKCSVLLAVAVAAVFAPRAQGNTLLWYRFDGEGTTITNIANPGVMDGTLKSISAWGSSFSLGDTTDNFPVRTDAFADGVRVIDPRTDALYPKGKALSWTGDKNHTGTVVVPGENLTSAFKEAKSFTYEAFFKVSQATIDRAAALADYTAGTMFPIIHWGKDATEGVMFSLIYCKVSDSNPVRRLAPYARMVCNKDAEGTTTGTPSITANWGINDPELDVWHHVALVVEGQGDGTTATMTFYLDYQFIGSQNASGYYGVHYASGTNPLMLGANIFNSGRSFLGELAEVRVSDEALAVREFLRPVPPGPVDADTLVYLPLGDTPWFARQTRLSGIWNLPLNGAPTAAWNPTNWQMTTTTANIPCGVPALADEAHGTAVRGGCLDTNALADVKSYTFSADTAITGSGLLGHILEFPKTDLATLYAGDFTFEWFFKTTYQESQAMIVNPWTKVMIYNHKVYPRVGDYNYGGGTGSVVADDGKWHHCALVYRHGVNTFECWVDYKLDQIRVADALASNSQGFYFGGQGYKTQVFNGQLDDLRITKRALAPHEFLTTIPVAANTSPTDILHATLESSLASGQDEFFVSNGVVRVAGTNAKGTASYADILRDIDYDNDGEADATSAKALVLDGSNYLDFTAPATWYTRDFTAEFFAKVTGAGNNAQLVRLAPSTSLSAASRWTVSPVGTVSILRTEKGNYVEGATTSLTAAADPALSIADDKWHHWAVTASTDYSTATTTFKVYRDYEEVAGGSFNNSVIYFGTYVHSLLFGYSGTANGGVQGQFDEIRFRPGVQPVSSFMRCLPSSRSTILVFR